MIMDFRIYILALFAATLMQTACDSSDPETENGYLAAPTVEVDGTTLRIACATRLEAGQLATMAPGFVFYAADSGTERTVRARVEGTSFTTTVEGLPYDTQYVIYAYLDAQRAVRSPEVTATTGPAPDDPLAAKYAWAELPASSQDEGLYYATHFCPDLNTAAGTPARNYTVCYDSELYSAVWVAYPLHRCYKGSTDRTDAWAFDPLIPEEVQPWIVERSYQPQPGYSRGHMIASADRTATRGMNEQTFFVTNMSPQWQNGFNSGVWSNLEGACWNEGNVCADTLFVVTGAYYVGSTTTVTDKAPTPHTITVPTHLYKVMIRSKAGNTGRPLSELTADELQCVGFWLENRSYTGDKSPLTDYMTSVAEIEQATGMRFFTHIPAAPKERFDATEWSF